MIPFLNACVRCALNRYNGTGPQFELTVQDIDTTEMMRQELALENSASGLQAPTAYGTAVSNQGAELYNASLPAALDGINRRAVFEPLKMEDDVLYKKLILRISRRAGITRMSFDCFGLLFKRFQLIVAKVLVPAGVVLFESSRPKTALEALAEAQDAAEFSDEDDDEEEEEDDDDSDSEDNPESDEEEDPFDVLDAPGSLVADKVFIREFMHGQIYGFGRDWSSRVGSV